MLGLAGSLLAEGLAVLLRPLSGGLWAATQLGLSGDAAAAYATALVTDYLENQRIDDILDRVSGDLAVKGVSRDQVAAKLQECLHRAVQQLQAET